MSTLQLDNVVGGYGDTQILHGVSINVDPGEIVVIIGPNGAGKSTAIKAVFGLLNLTGGRVLLGNYSVYTQAQQGLVWDGHHLGVRGLIVAKGHDYKAVIYSLTDDSYMPTNRYQDSSKRVFIFG